MMDIEEGGWIIPHFILTIGILRFPPDERGMCMGMLYSVDLGIPMRMMLGFLRFLKILCRYGLTIRVAWCILFSR